MVLDFNGASLSRAPNKVASYICKRESRPGVSSNNPEWRIASLSLLISRLLSLLETIVVRALGGFSSFRLKQIGLWSEIGCSRVDELMSGKKHQHQILLLPGLKYDHGGE